MLFSKKMTGRVKRSMKVPTKFFKNFHLQEHELQFLILYKSEIIKAS